MYRAAAVIILLFMIPVLGTAQDRNNPDVDDWEEYRTDQYVRGDKSIIISLGTLFPLFFTNNGSFRDMKFTPPLGASGYISYNYFLTSNIFIGGEGGVQFMPSIAGDTLYTIPFGLRGGYQFKLWRIEIPVSLTAGFALQRFLSFGYFGFFMKAGVAGYYRITSAWSLGLAASWYWFPQWTNDPARNMDGHLLDLTLSARYSF